MTIYSVSRVRGSSHQACEELISLRLPDVGQPLALFRGDTGRRVRTSCVQRVLHSETGTTYVATENSVYAFAAMSERPPRRAAAQ